MCSRLRGRRLHNLIRSSRSSSRRQCSRTFTLRSRKTRAPKLPLELAAGRRADLSHHPTPLADQDALLGLRLDPHLRIHLHQAVVPPPRLADDHLDRVRHLVPRSAEHLLTDQLGEVDLAGQVRPVLRRVEQGPSGQQLGQTRDQRLDAGTRLGADREHLVHRLELRRCRQRDGGLRGPDAIALVDRAEHGGLAPGAEQCIGDEPVARPHARGAVDDHQGGVRLRELVLDPSLHPLCQRVSRSLDAGEVHEHHLPAVGPIRGDAPDRAAGGLGTIGDDRHLGAHDRVDQRRLADVRPAGHPDEAGAGHRPSFRITASWSPSISPSSVSWS